MIMEDMISLFRKVLANAYTNSASDVHLSVGSPWKYRIRGKIVPVKGPAPLKPDECEAIVCHILQNTHGVHEQDLKKSVQELQDFDCSYSLPGISRFRVNICRQRGTFSVVLRVVPFEIPTVDSLGLPAVIRDISMEERGLILVTGVTGSGKSTTLAAMIKLINETKLCKIVTIEDPIEYLHKEVRASVIQREIGADTESFSKALRAALRQDPDIILVGEMRDRATIDIALKAAETGHLVLSTLHTIDAPKTIQRIISSFDLSEEKVIRKRLAETLTAVISQRLLTRADDKGRIAALEVMRNTLSIKDCIENPEKMNVIKDFIEKGRDQNGMQTFDQHLFDLFSAGLIDLETAKSAAASAADFELSVKMGQ